MENTAQANNAAAEQLKEIKELVDHVYDLKLKSDVADKAYQAAKNKLSEIMEKAEVDKMAGDECNASLKLKNSVSFPKEPSDKLDLLNYIVTRDNEVKPNAAHIATTAISKLKEFFAACPTAAKMLTFNANSFSSWYNAEIEAQAKEGNFEVEIPVVKPYEYYSVGLRKRATRAKK